MGHITASQFKKFIVGRSVPEWFMQYQKDCFSQISRAKETNFRHGLNICIEPIDFSLQSLVPQKCTMSSKISAPDTVSVTSEPLRKVLDQGWAGTDQWYYLNEALTNNAISIVIPSDMRLESPLEIELDHEDGQLFSTLHIHAQKNSSARIIILKKSKKHTYLSTTVRILADAGSNVECINVQTMGPDAVHVEDNQASILKDASVSWTGLCLGSGYVRSHTISHLNGQGSATKNTVLYVATGKQRYDIYTASLHNAPHTSSQIVTRGAVNHEAKALSRGLVQIGEGAPGSNGYETQDALLLGDQAEADAIPNLEIHNHNVKCSHGSTIGQIDKDKVFYLMSRGLKKEQAQTKIVEGYFNPIIERISKDDVKRRIRDTIVRALR